MSIIRIEVKFLSRCWELCLFIILSNANVWVEFISKLPQTLSPTKSLNTTFSSLATWHVKNYLNLFYNFQKKKEKFNIHSINILLSFDTKIIFDFHSPEEFSFSRSTVSKARSFDRSWHAEGQICSLLSRSSSSFKVETQQVSLFIITFNVN